MRWQQQPVRTKSIYDKNQISSHFYDYSHRFLLNLDNTYYRLLLLGYQKKGTEVISLCLSLFLLLLREVSLPSRSNILAS